MKRKQHAENTEAPRPGFVVRIWRRSRFLRLFARNLLLALLIEFVFLPVFGPLLGVSRLEENTLDLMMHFFSNTNRIQFREIPAAFTWIDVDDESMKAWGDPPLTPRAKLLELIGVAAQNGARAIVVDFNFSRSYSQYGPEFKRADQDFEAFLHGYGQRKEAPPILLLRPITAEEGDSNSACPHMKRTLFDEGSFPSDRVQWTSVRFDIDSDYILRRWRLFERVCDDGRPRVLPSMQLAVAANVSAPAGAQELNQWLLQFRPASCTDCREESRGLLGWRSALQHLAHGKESVDPLQLGAIRVDPAESELEKRIIFRLPLMSGSERRSYAQVKVANEAEPTPVLDRLPAEDVLAALAKNPQTQRFRGRIVFIGASFHDSGDWFATPTGRMPGVLVLINATYSLMEYGQLHEKSIVREVIDLLLLVAGMTLIFTFVEGMKGLLLSTALFIVYLVPNSFALFQQGRWLDFVFPLVGIELHHLTDYLLERYELIAKHAKHEKEA